MRKKLSLFMVGVMVISMLAGCGSSKSSDDSNLGEKAPVSSETSKEAASDSSLSDNLRVGVNADIADMAPYSATSNGRNSVMYAVYEYLGVLEHVGGDLVGQIMKDWTTEDGLSYDINIYDNIHDTDNNPITADDIVFSFEKAKEKGNNTNTKQIVSIEKTGDYSVHLVIAANYVGGFAAVLGAVPIVSEKAYKSSSDEMATDPVGTSPYKVKEFVPGSSLTIEKTDNYWQTDESKRTVYATGNPKTITYNTIKEASQMAISLETGVIDIGLNMDATEATRFMKGGSSSSGFTVFDQETNIGNVMFLSGDPKGVFYDNPSLRKAVLYAIDKQGLVDGALQGYGVVEYSFGAESFADFNEKWKSEDYYNYDPNKAKDLLGESGYSSGNLDLRIMTDNTAQRNKVAQIIQGYLSVVGIKSNILQYDSALFNSYKTDPTQWDICLDNSGASDFIVSLWRSKFDARQYELGSTNGWNDPKMQELLEKALSFDGHTQEDVDAFHYYLKDQAYAMGLFNHKFFTVTKNGIKSIDYDAKMFVICPAVGIE